MDTLLCPPRIGRAPSAGLQHRHPAHDVMLAGSVQPTSSTRPGDMQIPPPPQHRSALDKTMPAHSHRPANSLPNSAPSSQDSYRSIASTRGPVGAPLPPLSTASYATADTSQTSQYSARSTTQGKSSQEDGDKLSSGWRTVNANGPAGASRNHARLQTPENQVDRRGSEHAFISPTSTTSPISGTKRMADGAFKSQTNSLLSSPVDAASTHQHRAESTSSAGSKAGEAAAQLKTNLAYAMAKVQHGWEHRSIDEVEQLAASLSPRPVVSTPGRARNALDSSRVSFETASPQTVLANGTSRLSMRDAYGQISPSSMHSYPAVADGQMSPPSKRHSATYQPTSPYALGMHPAALAPAPDIRPSSHHRRTSSGRPAPLLPATHVNHSSRSPPNHHAPTTPKSAARPGTLRTQTQTQQAEQDAMDALMLMGSPNNNGHFPKNSQPSSQPSPLAAAFTNGAAMRHGLQHRSGSELSSLSSSSGGYLDPAENGSRAALLDAIEAES